jgi:MFS family permease
LFTRIRRAHYLFAASLFGLLGFHVGVWAVQLAALSAGLHLDPAALGAAVTVAAAAGLVSLFAGGTLADRVGRRPVLVIGLAGTGTAFVLIALAGRIATLIPAVALYGLSVSFVDLGANTVGSAYEQAYAVTAMTGLHAWFSGGALAGALGSATALSAGVSYRAVYLALAAVMAAGLVTALIAAIPVPPSGSLGREERPPTRSRVWRIPAVLFAIALISVTFFGDGALESFLSSYLQRTLAGGVLLSGIGIGSYHCASLLGRLTATATLRRYGERRIVTAAGLLAATGLLAAVMAPDAAGAIGGLLLVGFAIAPVVPTTLSLAGRSAPGRSGQAVATATAAGYGAFILSPLTIGLIAQATSLRLALGLLVLTSLGIAGLATQWPGSAPRRRVRRRGLRMVQLSIMRWPTAKIAWLNHHDNRRSYRTGELIDAEEADEVDVTRRSGG